MAPTQKALYIPEKSANFVIGESEIYTPGPGEVLVKIQATSLNPVDWKIQKSGRFLETFPAIIGLDIAGDVEQVGEGVTDFKKGDRVFTQGPFNNSRMTSFQQYTLAQTNTLAKIPENISYDQASTLPVALAAAYAGLYSDHPHGFGVPPPISPSALGKYAGLPIIVLGGASSVGQNVIQLAKISGFSPIISTASLQYSEYLKSLGATHTLDRNLSLPELQAEIVKITNNEPVKHVFDAISIDSTKQLGLDLLAPRGQLAVVTPTVLEPNQGKSIRVVAGTFRIPRNVKLFETFFHDVVSGFLEKGLIKTNAVEVLPGGLAGIPDGLARIEANQVSKLKLVAHPQETA